MEILSNDDSMPSVTELLNHFIVKLDAVHNLDAVESFDTNMTAHEICDLSNFSRRSRRIDANEFESLSRRRSAPEITEKIKSLVPGWLRKGPKHM